MKQYSVYIFGLILLFTSCGISEDCFKGNGNKITQTFPLDGFTKIKVYDGVGLVIKEGPNYGVRIETSDKIINDIEVKLEGEMLVVKDKSTCNIARDYGLTTVYVTTPNLNEIHSKTNQDIKSEGVLSYPSLKITSMDLSDGAGTGDFYLTLNCINLFIESNNVSNFYISGLTNDLNVSFFWGNGKFLGSNFMVSNLLYIFHRGSNDITVCPLNIINGDIYGAGNIIIKNMPIEDNIIEHYTGKIIRDY